MLLPYLNAPEQTPETLSQFGGYNHRLSINEGEFFDMQNMSARDFPLAAVREKRGTVDIGGSDFLSNAQGIVAENKLIIPYIGKGDIGVKILEDVAATEITPITDGVTFEGEDGRYTKICDFRNDPIINEIKGGFPTTGLIRFISENGTITKKTSGKTPVIKEDGLYIKWPHEKIDKGVFWARVLFSVCYVHEREGNIFEEYTKRLIISANDNEYLSNAAVRNALVGEDYYIHVNQSEWKKVKILAIEKLGRAMVSSWGTSEYNNGLAILRKGDWAITVSMPDEVSTIDESYIKVNDEFIIAATDPLTEEIAAREDEKTTLRKLNPPTIVPVEAISATHLRVLLGKTLNFSGEDIYISDVDTTDGEYKIYLDRPHGAITAEEAKITGDRLFLCELNPGTGEAITSNVFAAAEGEHRLIEMGVNLVIFPEKVVVNTLKKNADGQFNEIDTLEHTNILKGNYAYRLCDVNGEFYDSGAIQNTAPSTKDGRAWIDTSEEPPILKVWSEQTSQWAVTQPYCEIYTKSDSDKNLISEVWQVGDAIELEFGEEGGGEYMAPQKDQKYFVISAVGENEDGKRYIRIPLAVKSIGEVSATLNTDMISIKRTIPEMDFIIENENRLWGCKYGLVDGEMINEIFACKLGDPKNWHHFTNTAIDSYYVSMGADGNFTGAISYGGNPVFFREDCMHRIYGNYPANYSLKTYECHGVEAGSDKSLAVMNDVLFYKSPVGVMAYTGATPVNISECFGNVKYKNAIACALGNKMYFSATDGKGERILFVFDDSSKLWHKEDNLDIKDFTVFGGEIYALTEENRIISMSGMNGTAEDDFEWVLESGKIGFMTPYRKRISKINIRLLMELDARASISIQYDSSGHFEHISNIKPSGKVKSISIPVMPRRCDHFALKIAGKGDCKILSITKFTEGGSDIE